MSERELLALVENPDGEWAAKKQALRVVSWDAYTEAERQRLSVVLTEHPDPVVREIAATPLATWSYRAELLTLATDPSFLVRKSAIYGLTSVPADPTIAAFAWDYALHDAGTAAYEALRTYVAHAPPAQAKDRLTELARTDPRESIQTTAISSLTALHAAPELESLLPLLRDPPGVTWAVHIAILDALRSLRLPAPDLDDLAAVDNLDLMCSVLAVRCATT
jgi:HEAT repeat protein